jgi:predicted dinucleotide-utilizing enzyme
MLRFGLLGCGRIAKRRSELLGGNHIDGASLVAVCDPLRPRADAVASKFGVPASYDTLEFLARKDIDVVALLTPKRNARRDVIACDQTRRRRKADGVVVETSNCRARSRVSKLPRIRPARQRALSPIRPNSSQI